MTCERIKVGTPVAIICSGRERKRPLKFPAKPEEMLAAGYRDIRTHGTCRSCGALFDWWTTPNEQWMPVSNLPNGLVQPHHIDCPDAQRYRDASRGYKARTEAPKPKQGSLF